jgi:hypothetical protein
VNNGNSLDRTGESLNTATFTINLNGKHLANIAAPPAVFTISHLPELAHMGFPEPLVQTSSIDLSG